jgi:hypothetical protein
MFPGFTTLSKEDQTLLQKKLGTSKASGKKAGKKRKGSAMEETKGKQSKKLKEEKKGKTEEEKKEEEALKVILIFFPVCYRPIPKIIVILFSSELNFNQGNHCRLIEYFKTNSFAKYN